MFLNYNASKYKLVAEKLTEVEGAFKLIIMHAVIISILSSEYGN